MFSLISPISRNLFTGLTPVDFSFIPWNTWRRPLRFRWFALTTMRSPMASSASLSVLVNAAHDGERLVHELGVKSITTESAASTKPA